MKYRLVVYSPRGTFVSVLSEESLTDVELEGLYEVIEQPLNYLQIELASGGRVYFQKECIQNSVIRVVSEEQWRHWANKPSDLIL